MIELGGRRGNDSMTKDKVRGEKNGRIGILYANAFFCAYIYAVRLFI